MHQVVLASTMADERTDSVADTVRNTLEGWARDGGTTCGSLSSGQVRGGATLLVPTAVQSLHCPSLRLKVKPVVGFSFSWQGGSGGRYRCICK